LLYYNVCAIAVAHDVMSCKVLAALLRV